MQKVQIQTAQNVFIDYPVASLGDRILAFLLDGAIVVVYFISVTWLMAKVNVDAIWLIITAYLPVFFYHLISELVTNGQSIGKIQLKIRVVKLDGSAPGLGSYLLRWMLRFIDIHLFSAAIAILMIVIGGKGQRLGDLAAGTTVIKLRPITNVAGKDVIKVMQEDTYDPVFKEVTQLNDRDIEVVKEALKVNREYANITPAFRTSEKIQELLKIETDMPPIKFLYTVVKDYAYLTSR